MVRVLSFDSELTINDILLCFLFVVSVSVFVLCLYWHGKSVLFG